MKNNSCALFPTSVPICDKIWVMKSGMMRQVGLVMYMGEGRNSDRVVFPIPDRKQECLKDINLSSSIRQIASRCEKFSETSYFVMRCTVFS